MSEVRGGGGPCVEISKLNLEAARVANELSMSAVVAPC